MLTNEHLVVGISGSSGTIYGIRLLKALAGTPKIDQPSDHEQAGRDDPRLRDGSQGVRTFAPWLIRPIRSTMSAPGRPPGSFRTLGMVIAPCSMKTLAEIATGMSTNLLTRAADVTLKERRRLVLMVRETPFNRAHLKNMLDVTDMGAIVAPPVPAFYTRPQSLDAMVDHSVGRVLDLFGIDNDLAGRWNELRADKT